MLSGTAAPLVRRAATLLAAFVLVAAGLAGQPAYAVAATSAPAQAAAGWLATQLVDGERFEADLGDVGVFPDQGLTLDAVLAFAAAGVASDHADAALSWVAQEDILANYLGTELGGAFAGAYAKLAFTTQVYGLDPASFGGVDVIGQLRDLQAANGRFSDDSDFGDNSNAFSQAFAILALDRTADGAPADAVAFLVSEQCPDGGIPLIFGEDTCTSEVDATGVAAQALLAAGETEAADAALDWLVSQQQPSGGFPSGPQIDELNANSTGLAGQALGAGGRDQAADQAAAFLRTLQVGCDGPEAEQGAVAYDETGFDPATVVRATAQAALGLAGVSLAELDGTTAGSQVPALDCDGDPSPSPSPSPSPTTAPPPGGTGGEKLPVTGTPALGLAGAGVLLAGAGGVIVWATRLRRRDQSSS